MSIEDRIDQALVVRPYLKKTDIQAIAGLMMSMSKAFQSRAYQAEVDHLTCRMFEPDPARVHSHVGYVVNALHESANIASRLYESAVIAALVTANVHESELRARGMHWTGMNWGNPLAGLDHIASLAILHPKVSSYDVRLNIISMPREASTTGVGRVSVLIEMVITRTR